MSYDLANIDVDNNVHLRRNPLFPVPRRLQTDNYGGSEAEKAAATRSILPPTTTTKVYYQNYSYVRVELVLELVLAVSLTVRRASRFFVPCQTGMNLCTEFGQGYTVFLTITVGDTGGLGTRYVFHLRLISNESADDVSKALLSFLLPSCCTYCVSTCCRLFITVLVISSCSRSIQTNNSELGAGNTLWRIDDDEDDSFLFITNKASDGNITF